MFEQEKKLCAPNIHACINRTANRKGNVGKGGEKRKREREKRRGNYFLHKIRSHRVAADVGELVLAVYRLIGGGGQHEDLVPLVGEQCRVNFDR